MSLHRCLSVLGSLLLAMPASHAIAATWQAAGDSQDAYLRGGQIVRCQSRDLRTEYCSVDGRYRARLVNQLSQGACIEGQTWGQDSRGIWVSNGCRGEFMLDSSSRNGYGEYTDWDGGQYGNDRYGNRGRYRRAAVVCESKGSRTVYCDADTRYGVRLVEQFSDRACVEGRTWGWNNRGIWVTRGCRGRFALGGTGYDGGYGGGRPQYLQCQSNDKRYRFCPSNGYIRQAQIRRQLSDARCTYNWSWGYRNDGIWVDKGCRAEFEVY